LSWSNPIRIEPRRAREFSGGVGSRFQREHNLADPGLAAGNGGTGNSIDDFLQRLPGSFRWPKPNAKRLRLRWRRSAHVGGGRGGGGLAADGKPEAAGNACVACGVRCRGARFCVWCGAASGKVSEAPVAVAPGSAQHHYHHHYHHLVPNGASTAAASTSEPESSAPRDGHQVLRVRRRAG